VSGSEGIEDQDEELRAAPRISLMLRAAKLICPTGEFLCILRDVSATGLKAKLFHPMALHEPVELELSNGVRYPLEPVWERDGHVGFRFGADGINLAVLVDEADRFPKRQLRLKLDLPVTLTAQGKAMPARLRDLSQQGALIELGEHLALRQLVCIDTTDFPARHARVRWRRGAAHGLVFHEGFRLDELARLMERLQNADTAMRATARVNH
jgi:hypothetical protein